MHPLALRMASTLENDQQAVLGFRILLGAMRQGFQSLHEHQEQCAKQEAKDADSLKDLKWIAFPSLLTDDARQLIAQTSHSKKSP
jgi:hypothetical protein